MRSYSAARGTFWQAWPAYYDVCGRMLPAWALSNLIERNI